METIKGLLAFFSRAMHDHCWEGADFEAGDMQDTAVELGLLKEVPYSIAEHGVSLMEQWDYKEGQPIYVFADELKALTATKLDWIPKEERLPDVARPTSIFSKMVFVTNGLLLDIARFNLKDKTCSRDCTHWLPLSALPPLPTHPLFKKHGNESATEKKGL